MPACGKFRARAFPTLFPLRCEIRVLWPRDCHVGSSRTFRPILGTCRRCVRPLVGYLKNERITSSDWANYFPTRWEDNVARGVLDELDALFTSPETEVIRSKESVTFVGRGPYDLYTEVTVQKSDGAVTNAYVEID